MLFYRFTFIYIPGKLGTEVWVEIKALTRAKIWVLKIVKKDRAVMLPIMGDFLANLSLSTKEKLQ